VFQGAKDLPLPAVQVLAYTTYVQYERNVRPLFSIVGDSDGLANAQVMSNRVNVMRNAGLDVDFTIYPNLGHGFALGNGTSAEGWLPLAIRFWEKYIGS
jgi:acetyl esterase/lipase